MFELVLLFVNMENKSNESISSLLSDNQLINVVQFSNHFDYFWKKSIAEKINRHCRSKKTHFSYLGPENNKTIFLFPTVSEDIENQLSWMKTNTTSGSNSITF